MIKITVEEARLILANKEEELSRLQKLRHTSKTNVFRKKDGVKELVNSEHEFTIDEITKLIEKVEKEIRILRVELTVANVNTLVDFTDEDGQQITLQEAIYMIKQLRLDQGTVKDMGEMKLTSKIVDNTPRILAANGAVDRSYEEITEPNFDTLKYRKKAKKIELLITKLEMEIKKANLNVMIKVPKDIVEVLD